METDKSKIGELYRNAFKEFSAEPSPEVWENISKHSGLKTAPKPRILSPGKIILFTAAVIIGVSVFIFNSPDHSVPASQQKQNTATKVAKDPAVTGAANAIPKQTAEKKNFSVDQTAEKQQLSSKGQEKTVSGKNPGIITPTVKPRPNISFPEIEQKDPNTASTATIPSKQEAISYAASGSKLRKPEAPGAAPMASNPDNQIKSTIEFSEDQMICKGDSVKLTASGGESYSWSNGATSGNITVSPSITTTYGITVTDFTGALIINEIIVKVGDCGTISIPNAFTPNADGTNDIFRASGNDLTDFRMLIFSRTSQIVFESHDIGKGWDGFFKGKMAEPGVYVYQVKYTDALGKSHTVNGHLTLLR